MLKCPVCENRWDLVGNQWTRMNGKVDYRCSHCKSKLRPVEVRAGESVKDKNGFACGGVLNNKHFENILIVGDLHLPFTLEGYLPFCENVYNKYNCDHAIFIGDLIDNHFSSFHATDPDGMSAADELDFAISELKKWSKIFPYADVCTGNHDLIQLRKAYKEGISKRWIRDFGDVLGVGWNFKPSFEYNNCLFRHGMNMAASVKSGSEMMNVVQGHFHTKSSIDYHVGRGKKVFGMQVPCGIDRESYAMAYAKEFPKPAIGCSVLLEYGRLPIIEMMDL